MAVSQTPHPHCLNHWLLHYHKLALQFKCSLCLKVYDKPVLFPCDHIICSSCIPKSILFGLECPLCKEPYVEQDLRQVPFLDNVVNIYKSLDASFSVHMLNSGKSTSGTRGNEGQYEAVEVDMNQMESSPESSPSSGASKGVAVDSRDLGSGYDTAGVCPSKKSAKRTADDIGALRSSRNLKLHCKKQKSLNQGQLEKYQAITPATVMDLQNSSCTGLGITNTGNDFGNQHIGEPDPATLVNFICAFCQTWKITEGSGPMQHFANAKQVFGSDAGRSNVIHVHQSCIEWAPQIYYQNTTMKNLDKELARAGKLKCTYCGLKGAALGCLVKSCRRSYHVPCAYEISECRWDTDNYLMLCPTHASHKFPSEKSKKSSIKKCSSAQRNQPVPSATREQKTLCDFDFWASSPTGAKNWVLCGSALSADETYMLVKFANLCGATVVKNWNPNVTHMIAATDANGACSRTLKVLMAILNGRWILKTDWIEACMQSKSPIHEEPYEITLDNHGCHDGPRTGRLRLMKNEPKLFNSMKFFFSGEFVEAYKNDLQNLVIAAGGTILTKSEELPHSNEEQCHPSTTIVVYNDDSTGEVSEVLQRQAVAKKLGLESGFQVIAHTWILDSIASGVVKPFVQRLRNVEYF